MKQLKEVKGTVLCENFNEKFCYKAKVMVNNPKRFFTDLDDFNASVIDYINIFDKNDVELRSFILGDYVSVFRFNVLSYCFEFSFHLSTGIVHLDVWNASKKLFGCTFIFEEYEFVSFFHDDEENASEPEQPEEDAEEQENPEQNKQEFELYQSVEMPLCVFQLMQNKVNAYIDDNDIMEKYGDKEIPCGVVVKIERNISKPSYKCEIYDDSGEEAEKRISKIEPLTPLERTVFEEIENCFERYNDYAELARTAEYGAEYNGESAEEISRYGHLANEQIFNSDYLKELISKAGLDETYQAWLRERKKQEALTVI